jgi:adenylosuccinate synthase
VVDLGYGDAGKGTMVDHLAERHGARLVVRVHGGAQAGHNVVTPDGRHHTFSQLGSASFLPGVRTLHAPGMAVAPLALRAEAAALERKGVPDPLSRLLVDRRCLVTTPLHQAANRIRERLRGGARHGTCGVGYGETVRDAAEAGERAIRARHLEDPAALRARLGETRERLVASLGPLPAVDDAEFAFDIEVLRDLGLDAITQALVTGVHGARLLDAGEVRKLVAAEPAIVVEGAQGVLLDEWAGFHPHTTWSTTTTASANAWLREVGWDREVVRLGGVRCYGVRHGAGPMVGEDPKLAAHLPEPHNAHHPWQGSVRLGRLDVVALRYALAVCGDIDALAVTHLDRLAHLPEDPWVVGWEGGDPDPDLVVEHERGVTKRLALPERRDLGRQERLTALARRAAAATDGPRTYDPLEWCEALESAAGAPVSCGSFGPTRSDKTWWRS